MICIEQTKLSFPDGNCFAACLASILELPLDDVPHHVGERWLERYNEWIARFNLTMVNLTYSTAEGEAWHPEGYAILAADSPRGDRLHAVVCLDGKVVWDPHPEREAGLGKRQEWTVFLALDPAKLKNES